MHVFYVRRLKNLLYPYTLMAIVFIIFVQTSSGAHPSSYPMGTRGSFPGGKVAGA
jgi:hypothetical protein